MTRGKNKGIGAAASSHICPECDQPHEPRIYQESEFKLIAPHDLSGKPMTFASFQAPPKYNRIIELAYCDQRTPWQTYSDVMRAILDRGCAWIGDALGGTIVPGILHSLKMMNRLIDQAREANDFAQSIDQLEHEAKRMVDGGMRESAVGLVYQYREQAKGMPDRILRRKLVGDINQRFGYLLKGNQGRKDHEGNGGSMIEVDHEHDEERRGGGHEEDDE